MESVLVRPSVAFLSIVHLSFGCALAAVVGFVAVATEHAGIGPLLVASFFGVGVAALVAVQRPSSGGRALTSAGLRRWRVLVMVATVVALAAGLASVILSSPMPLVVAAATLAVLGGGSRKQLLENSERLPAR